MAKKLLGLVVFILIVSMFFGTSVFKTLGGWDLPPAYHGNPYAPGGVGAANDYIFGMLATYGPFTGKFELYLAESFEEKDNQLIVKLKKGFYWDDGVPFTSKDVKANFIVGGGVWTWSHIWDSLDSIETPDDYTVVFNFNKNKSILVTNYILTELQRTPYHIFEEWLQPSEELIKLRKEYNVKKTEELKNTINEKYEALRENIYAYKPEKPIGIGPFKLVKVTADTMLLEKVDKYPGIENVKIDRIEIGKFTTNELAWAQFMAGNVDIEKPATPRDVVDSILKKQPKMKHIPVPDFASMALVMNQEKYPFSDVRFRQALAYIIDRDKVRELSLYYGTTTKYISGVLPSMINKWVGTDSLNSYDRDLDKASQLLIEMGLKKDKDGFWCDANGKKLEFEIVARQGYSDWIIAAEEISRELTDFGLSTTVRIVQGEIFPVTLSTGDYDMTIEFSVFAKRHPLEGFERLYSTDDYIMSITGANSSVKGAYGEELDLTTLVQELSQTWELDEQKEIVSKLAWATNEYLPVIELLEKNAQFFVCDGIRVTGWPYGSELEDEFGFNWRFATVKWMVEGILKPVE